MNPWLPKIAVILACVVLVAIRAPHGSRSMKVPVVESRKGSLETFLLTLAWISFFLPFVWIVSPLLDAFDYPAHPVVFGLGLLGYGFGLWLFHRSHADLGTNWSITLEIREGQRVVAEGIYRHLRHPMYLALLLYSLGQALVLPNWVAGPSYVVVMGLIVALRLGPEERMMRDTFGAEYAAYASKTKRLLPKVW